VRNASNPQAVNPIPRAAVPERARPMRSRPRPIPVRRFRSVAAIPRGRASLPKALLGALLLVASCAAVGRDFEPPRAAVPEKWLDQPGAAVLRDAPELAHWWRRLDDPVLNGFVERAAAGSLDLREALARVREARALRGVAAADRWPTVDLGASYTRLDESENTPFGGFAQERDVHEVGIDASWELDLWGRVRRSVEAADADLAATLEDARDVQVTVAAEVALAYVDYRAFQRRLALARTNVELQLETLELVRARLDAGLVGERDVAQALTNVEATRSRVPALEIGARAAENRLGVLVGVAPGSLAAELAAGDARAIPVAPPEIAVGVPADLLRRRPDVRRAERELAAATARVGVAEGDLYPRLSLLGSLGFQAEDAADLFESPSRVFGIGPSLRWNLFDSGRLRDRVDAQEARVEQALVRWERSVLGALEETENALASFVREQSRRASLAEAATHARRSVELARTQYTEGLTDFQAVLDSQRALADLEDTLAQSSAAITQHLVRLYKSLGGGWEHGIGEARVAQR
jgi:NodT family efflux transporter outer membrane factor (OMF) lipoprotein